MEIKRCTSDLDINNKEVQFGSNESGYVYQLDTGNNFDGSTYRCTISNTRYGLW